MPKLPEMKLPSSDKLAFWKKEGDIAPPPPPAKHLSPSPTDSMNAVRTSLAQKEDAVDIDDYRRKIDEIKDGIASTKNKMDGTFGGNTPLRSPYGVGATELSEAANNVKSDFKSAGNSIDQGFGRANELVSNSLSDAQKKFNSAVADVKTPSFEGGGFKAPADTLSTKSANNFKNTLADASSKLKSGLNAATNGGGFKQSLYDMNGQLNSVATSSAGKVDSTVDAARQRFSNALGSVSDRAIEAAKSSSEFGGNLKDKFVAAASELTPPLGGDNSFKPSFTRAADSVNADAQNLLNKGKESVAGLGGGFEYPRGNKSAPSFGNGTQAPTNGHRDNEFAASQNSMSDGGTFNRTRVATVTPASKAIEATPAADSKFGQRSGLDSSLTKAWNGGLKQSQLQPIQVGPATSNPGNGLRTAGLPSNVPNRPAASSIPAAFDQGYNAMTSHVSEIDIPTKILSGSGNYAPGSVNRVR